MSVICVSCTAILIGSLFRCVVDFILLDCGRESLWNQICPTRFNMCIVWRCAFSLFQTQAIGDTKFILGFLSLFCWTLLIPFFKKKTNFGCVCLGGQGVEIEWLRKWCSGINLDQVLFSVQLLPASTKGQSWTGGKKVPNPQYAMFKQGTFLSKIVLFCVFFKGRCRQKWCIENQISILFFSLDLVVILRHLQCLLSFCDSVCLHWIACFPNNFNL